MQAEVFYAYNTYFYKALGNSKDHRQLSESCLCLNPPHKSLCLAYVDRNETDT